MFGESTFAVFLVVFREALEAGLILGIILTVLAKLNAGRYFSHIALSVAVALAVSLGLGSWLAGLTDTLQEKAGEIIEGVISIVACGMLTYMFFWMEKQGRSIKTSIETKVQTAVSASDYWALMALPFFAVLREGAETVLFLKAVSLQSGGGVSAAGAVTGLTAAAAVTLLIFVGGKRIPLKTLFRVTGIFIVFVAAGLLAYGVHELNEAGYIPSVIEHVYNINPYFNEKEGLGLFAKAVFGYNGNPSLTEVIAYWLYLGLMFRGLRRENNFSDKKIG